MQVQVELPDAGEATLKVEVEETEVRVAKEKAARLLSQKRIIPGFRRGKAPLNVVERTFGVAAVRSETLDNLLPEVVRRAMDQAGVEAFENPEVADLNWDGGLSLTVKVLKRPEVRLGDYRQISLGSVVTTTVSEEEIEQALERLRESRAELAPAEGEKVQGDSFVFLDLEIFREGKLVAEESADNALADVAMMTTELREAILGAEEGDEREATVPESDGGFKVCRARIRSVKRKELPPLDDELARQMGPYGSLQELRASLENTIKRKREFMRREERERQVLDALVALAEMHISPGLLERRTADALENLLGKLRQERRNPPDDREELRRRLRADEELKLRRDLSLEAVAAAEKMEVSAAELEMQLQAWAKETGKPPEWWRGKLGEEHLKDLRQMILRDKALVFLLEHVGMEDGGERIAAGREGA